MTSETAETHAPSIQWIVGAGPSRSSNALAMEKARLLERMPRCGSAFRPADTAVAAHGRVVRRPASTPLRSEGGCIQTAGGAACPQPSYSEPATYRVPSWMQPFSLSLRAMPSALESCPVDRQIAPGPGPASGHSAS
jgi:hypothetical protein